MQILLPRWPRRVLVLPCLLALSASIAPVFAQDYYNLPLSQPGQASVAIDHRSATAYIIDLGKDKEGRAFLLAGKPLIGALTDAKVKRIVVICSHPHADHMGGIRAMFETPQLFFNDAEMTEPRFESIRVVEDRMSNSLATLLRSKLPRPTALKVEALSATRANALDGISTPEHDVFVETIPHAPRDKAGPHGRSIVTRIVLGRSFSIVDFDDGDSHVISEVCKELERRGAGAVDAFVVPHHGSSAHDITPILALQPKYAIITVNPRNRNRHPSPDITLQLIDALGADHVLFTGSTGGTEFRPGGLARATHTAADFDSYAFFIQSARERAELRGEKDRVAKYEQLRRVMLKAARRSAPNELVRERVAATGSMLSPELEIGTIPAQGSDEKDLHAGRIFTPDGKRPESDDGFALYLTNDPIDENQPRRTSKVNRELATRLAMRREAAVSGATPVELRYETRAGVEDESQPRLTTSVSLLQSGKEPLPITSPPATAPLATAPPRVGPPTSPKTSFGPSASAAEMPTGGMVYFTGDKLTAPGSSADLVGSTLDLCGGALCMRTSKGSSYAVPFKIGPLFAEVWQRTYERRIDAFYLSINPTRRFLGDKNGIEHAPSARMQFGTGKGPVGVMTNEVVTLGDIQHTQIGRILWQADVLFKSAALGFDVTASASSDRPRGPAALSAEAQSPSEEDFEEDPGDRWCRLCWTSGSQELVIDEATKSVRMKGNAVSAMAEAMTLKDGGLHSDPKRCWCEDAKALAKSLQRQANSGADTNATLIELRRLAELQSFIRWVRDNEVTVSQSVREAIKGTPAPPPYDVPTWTSGIRSASQVLVQEERTTRGSTPTFLMHVSLSDPAVMQRCVLPEWEKRRIDFPRAGLTFDRLQNAWTGPAHDSFLRTWMSSLAANVARCSGGRLLPPDGVIRETSLLGDNSTRFGIVTHLQPVNYHGGVLLGSSPSMTFLQASWQRYGTLRGLDGRLLFQRTGDDLHFWNASLGNYAPSTLEHVVIRSGKVVDGFASEGRVRFLIETQPGGIVREELRARPCRGFSRGLEWSRARHGDSAEVILDEAIWPCGWGQRQCVDGVNVILKESRDFPQGAPSIATTRVALVSPSTWIVDLDISPIKRDLDNRWARRDRTDIPAALSLAKSYANWGYSEEAESNLQEIIENIEGDTQDTNLSAGLLGAQASDFDQLLATVIIRAAVDDLRQSIESREISARRVIDRLRLIEKPVATMTPDVANRLWASLAGIAQTALDRLRLTPVDRATLSKIEQQDRNREGRTGALAGVLTGTAPPSNEYDDSVDD